MEKQPGEHRAAFSEGSWRSWNVITVLIAGGHFLISSYFRSYVFIGFIGL